MTATRTPRTEAVRADQLAEGDVITTITNHLTVEATHDRGHGRLLVITTAYDEARGRRVRTETTMAASAVVIRFRRPSCTDLVADVDALPPVAGVRLSTRPRGRVIVTDGGAK